MIYKIEIAKPAQKFIAKQPKSQQIRLLQAIQKLPLEGDIKKLAGRTNQYRLRVGDYRIIYEVHDDVLIVRVLNAGNRGDIYK